jgi:hypothetical protein
MQLDVSDGRVNVSPHFTQAMLKAIRCMPRPIMVHSLAHDQTSRKSQEIAR